MHLEKLLLLLLASPALSLADGDYEFASDVPGITERHLAADFWTDKLARPGEVLLDSAAIRQFNAHAIANDDTLVSLEELPDTLPGSAVSALIEGISKRSSYERILPDGRRYNDADWERLEAARNLDALPERVNVRFGLVVARTDMRTFPTRERVLSSETSPDLDRFQEHGLFPGTAVAILHDSADGHWLFVQSYNYAAWVERSQVAIGPRATVLDYVADDDFLVVTGSKVRTNYNPAIAAISELQLDMGTRLPLVSAADTGFNVHGQNPYASYVVKLPMRTANGRLEFGHALVARSEDVRVGYLEYTRENVLRQAFKFLGERYGWGHDYNGRDCTGFVSEVYRSFGIIMPRNSGDQGASVIGLNSRFDEDAAAATKQTALDDAEIGSLVYLPGHVAMLIGHDNGQPYIIHDVAGLSYMRDNGDYYRGLLHGVSVTPLLPMRVSSERTYLDRVYNVKTIALPSQTGARH